MIELFVPGRLCLLGEHSDWAGGFRAQHPALSPGYCLVTGTDQGLRATIEPLPDIFEISSLLPDGRRVGPARFAARPDALASAAQDDEFFGYAAGVAAEIGERYPVGGLRVQVTAADLPVRKGLSSSAAICVLVARAYNRLYGLGLSPRDEMELAYAGEHRTGSACGRMDQVCAFGRRTVFLTFDGSTLGIEPLVAGGEFWLLVVDLGRDKDTRRILADLNACFPDTSGTVAAGVREALGPRNAALLAQARRTVVAGDARQLGELMREAQEVFDRLVAPASSALAAPRLHEVLAYPAVRDLAWGGKGVGSQGDGCAQLVARGEGERDALAARLGAALGVGCFPVTLRPEAGDSTP